MDQNLRSDFWWFSLHPNASEFLGSGEEAEGTGILWLAGAQAASSPGSPSSAGRSRAAASFFDGTLHAWLPQSPIFSHLRRRTCLH